MSSTTSNSTSSSNSANCAYCGNREHNNDLQQLNDTLYKLFLEHKYYPRNAKFCLRCIRWATQKLESRRRKQFIERRQQSNSNQSTATSTSTSTSSSYNSSVSTAPMPHNRRMRSDSSNITDVNGRLIPDIDYPRGRGG